MTEKKTYRIQTACPQCGCSAVSHLSAEEIRARFGDVPNIQMECSECMARYETPMKEACPEFAKDCNLS
jgi:C4-type Zn-finger protein